MKVISKIALVLALTTHMSGYAAQEEELKQAAAPATAEVNYQWTETFKTNAGPITHTPQFVRFGFMTCGQGMTMSEGSSFNGFVFPATLELSVKSSRDEFIAAIKRAQIWKD